MILFVDFETIDVQFTKPMYLFVMIDVQKYIRVYIIILYVKTRCFFLIFTRNIDLPFHLECLNKARRLYVYRTATKVVFA